MYYTIRIKGHLDRSWQSWLNDLSIHHEEFGTTLLIGEISDQPALYGIMIKLSKLGVTLLSLQTEEREQPVEDP